jgi:glycosyltransferase involved in cell wall biosynthesis
VFAEAAYFSTLIISRDVGGVRDITNDGEFWYIYSDIEDILPLIKTQYIDMKKYQKYILDNYTYQITLQRICKEILGK